ncbi:penicillin acylase family protein [Actinospica robiniae]|uniref:penicillin acylase family protein n=1 Tax=Actinospica robiniae TaxID=304901 RepID=UPI0003F8B18F|nr:penicillin acylase family protein [Actinospica robiniae]
MATSTDPGASAGPAVRRRRRLLWRALAAVAVLLVLALLAAAGVAGWRLATVLRASYPQVSGSLDADGLGGLADVERDAAGVPQIYASTPHDLFLAQGYVQAQDRFWQMDVSRRYADGTLAAVLGASWVAHDELARALDLRSVALHSYSLLQPETKADLQAYAQGVNDYLHAHPGAGSLSVEYSVLGLPYTGTAQGPRPAAWTPIDTLSWLEAVSWDQDSAVAQEATRSLLTQTLTRTQIDALYPSDGAGSALDAWAVSGKLTSTGAPMLAAAPIAPPSLPSTWYQIGLHCEHRDTTCPYDDSGYTEPGVPAVLIGHNQSIAWSWSGGTVHNSDLYLEKVDGNQYLYNGHEYPVSERREKIQVAGAAPVTVTVRSTRHGPLLSDLSAVFRRAGTTAPAARAGEPGQGAPPGIAYGVAVDSTALAPNTTADALLALDQATSWDQFTSAARGLTAPAENMVYADTSGDIGYQAAGGAPARAAGDGGTWPLPGWTSAHDWTGAPGSALPAQQFDPEDGYIATSPGATGGVRAQRTVADLVGGRIEHAKLDAAGLAAVQDDAYDPEAAVLVPYLLRVNVDDFTDSAVALLRTWDYTEPAGSSAAAYYNAVWAELLRLVIGRQLPQDASAAQLGLDGSVSWDSVVNTLLTQPNNPWWGAPGPDHQSARDAMLAKAMAKARLDLTALMGKDVTTWTWGRVHTLTPESQTLGVGARPAVIKWLLDGQSLQLSGGGSDVAAADWNVGSDAFTVGAAPALRMVVDLSDPDNSRWIGQTGESGHVDDTHYLDQAPMWAAGETRPWPFTPSAVRASTLDDLVLRPVDG